MVRLSVDVLNEAYHYTIFSLLKRLQTLLLHNNHVSEIDKAIGEHLPNLKTLALTNNEVTELVDVDPLATCKNLSI
uniref:Uncharacterized protein n=1 Tax=Ditylenchus dipsaci TaxID=166011 RepID=A0A915EAI6_9BILA